MYFSTILSRIQGARHRLDIGDPDLPPPAELLEALQKVRDFRYGPAEGLQEFREAVASLFGVEPGEVVATAGGRHGLSALMWTFRKKRLLAASPYYPGYLEIAEIFDIKLELVETDPEGWVPQFGGRGVYVVNYPNNPTGVVLAREKIRELVDTAEFVISDEIYRDIVFSDFTSPLELSPSTAVVYSFSKVFSIPGLRIGAVVAPRDIAREVAKFNKATVNVPPTAVQRAVAEVAHILPRRKTWLSRIYMERAALAERLRLKFVKPGGAFYIFPQVGDDVTCFERAIAAGVSTLPGSLFGKPGHLRLALVESGDLLREAFQILDETCGHEV
ncbi:MAG: pyridoxal phosphate-dependent aminotransferase [Pyrobaculum sp.]